MNNLNKILILIAVLLAIAVGIAGFVYWQRTRVPVEAPAEVENPQADTYTAPGGLPPSSALELGNGSDKTAETNQPPIRQTKDPLRSSIEARARQYAATLGSFSSFSNFSNLVSLKPFSTDKMNKWIDDTIKKNAVSDLEGVSFTGVTTRSLGAKTVLLDKAEGRAVVEVDTQRQEQTAGGEEKVYYQEIRIELLEQSGKWLMDGAFWGEIK